MRKYHIVENCNQCGFLCKMHGFDFYCSHPKAVAKVYNIKMYWEQTKAQAEMFESCPLDDYQDPIKLKSGIEGLRDALNQPSELGDEWELSGIVGIDRDGNYIFPDPNINKQDKKMKNHKEIIELYCKLSEKVSRIINPDYNHSNDCFCGKGGFWSSDNYDGSCDNGFRNDEFVYKYIENAVLNYEKLLKESVK